MEATTHEIIHGIIDVVAAHNLLKYAHGPSKDEHLRMVTGGTMTALGFAYGPQLEERMRGISGVEMTEKMRKQVIYTAGGALLGGVATYLAGPDLYRHRDGKGMLDPRPSQEHPDGLLTIASVGWLGYSLLFKKQDPEWKERQLWGLGAGALGYLTGPQVLLKVKDIIVPVHVKDDAIEAYSRGAAAFGAVAGGALGWYLGRHRNEEP